MYDILAAEPQALCHYTALDALLAEYRQSKAEIERIAAYVADKKSNVMPYFLSGMFVTHRRMEFTANQLFDASAAIGALDAAFWDRALKLTDVLDVMPAAMRNEWCEQIRRHQAPPFDTDTVRATLQTLVLNRREFFADRVEGVFLNLSDAHLTNCPEGFHRRMVIQHVLDGWKQVSRDRVSYLHDLRCVIARFSGRPNPTHQDTYAAVDGIHTERRYGEWHDFDGGFRLRLHKVGTAHLEVAPEMADKLNSVLAWRNPHAIPASFRKARRSRAQATAAEAWF